MKSFLRKIIPSFLISWYHFCLAFLGAALYCFPSRKLKVIGVTGTNGKTTVVNLTAEILKEAGFRAASLSSIKFKIGDKEQPNTLKMTMPGRLKLQKFLRQAVDNSCQYAVIEVTSEGIKQYRHCFINFKAAVFTNLTPEHIESHGSFEKYKEAKGKLFQTAKEIHIINGDDPNAGYFMQFPAAKKIVYGLKDKKLLPEAMQLLGEFNAYNALAAIQVGLSQGIDLAVCQRAVVKTEKIPGRMEKVVEKPFTAVVDYAHTPDALEKVYKTLTGRKICVLGAAGGGRDKWKRPELGRIAGQYCDKIILTNEDPYEEDPAKILSEISVGIPRSQESVFKIIDRRKAIQKALSLAESGDTVVITGKGSEPWMCVAGNKKIPWDDKEVVKEELAKLKK